MSILPGSCLGNNGDVLSLVFFSMRLAWTFFIWGYFFEIYKLGDHLLVGTHTICSTAYLASNHHQEYIKWFHQLQLCLSKNLLHSLVLSATKPSKLSTLTRKLPMYYIRETWVVESSICDSVYQPDLKEKHAYLSWQCWNALCWPHIAKSSCYSHLAYNMSYLVAEKRVRLAAHYYIKSSS